MVSKIWTTPQQAHFHHLNTGLQQPSEYRTPEYQIHLYTGQRTVWVSGIQMVKSHDLADHTGNFWVWFSDHHWNIVPFDNRLRVNGARGWWKYSVWSGLGFEEHILHPGADMLMMMYRQAVVSDDSCVHLLMYATQEITNNTSDNLVLLRFSDKIHFIILERKYTYV